MQQHWETKKCSRCEGLVYYLSNWSNPQKECDSCRLKAISNIDSLLKNFLKQESELAERCLSPDDRSAFISRAELRRNAANALELYANGSDQFFQVVMQDRNLVKLIFRLNKERAVKWKNRQKTTVLSANRARVLQGGAPGLGKKK